MGNFVSPAIRQHLLECGRSVDRADSLSVNVARGFRLLVLQNAVNLPCWTGRELLPLACSSVETRKYPIADIDRRV